MATLDTSPRDTVRRPAAGPRRRDDLDHDLVAVLAMVAILALTAVAFVAQAVLPL